MNFSFFTASRPHGSKAYLLGFLVLLSAVPLWGQNVKYTVSYDQAIEIQYQYRDTFTTNRLLPIDYELLQPQSISKKVTKIVDSDGDLFTETLILSDTRQEDFLSHEPRFVSDKNGFRSYDSLGVVVEDEPHDARTLMIYNQQKEIIRGSRIIDYVDFTKLPPVFLNPPAGCVVSQTMGVYSMNCDNEQIFVFDSINMIIETNRLKGGVLDVKNVSRFRFDQPTNRIVPWFQTESRRMDQPRFGCIQKVTATTYSGFRITDNEIQALKAIERNSVFKIYPTQVYASITFETKDLEGELNVHIYNSMTSLMQTIPLTPNDKTSIDLSELPNGVYFAVLHNQGRTFVESFVKL